MNYQELTKKDGRILVLCNFDELLMEAFSANSMTEVQKNVKSNGEYIIQCPFCKSEGYMKHKLYVKYDLTVGHCFKCHRAFINVTDTIEYNIKSPVKSRNNSYNLVKLNNDNWTLDMYYNEFDEHDERGERYLMNRHRYLPALAKELGFKFYNHNIIMPFFFHGELIYYQMRFTNKNPIRYFFPPISNKPIYPIELSNSKDIIICEGVYDSIGCLLMYPDKMPIAILGSSVSDYQIEMIRTYNPRSITVYMDETKLSIGVIKKLQTVIDNVDYHYKRSDGQDPEEMLKYKIRTGKFVLQ